MGKTDFGRLERSKALKIHIPLNFVYNVIAGGLGYLLIPLSVNFLDVERYGIWVTLLSIMSWVRYFDIGIGNGLRNKLAESIAKHNIIAVRSYVSTAYAGIGLITLLFFLILLAMQPFVSWNKIFNTLTIDNRELSLLVLIVGFLFFIQFSLSLCKDIFYAYQKPSLPALSQALINLFAVIAIYCLTKLSIRGLIPLGIGYMVSMILTYLIMSGYFFNRHKEIFPSFGTIKLDRVRDMGSLGIKFFIIQFAALVIFTTDNMIITQVLGLEQVTSYNLVFIVFDLLISISGIIVASLWSAYTDAYTKGDIRWLKNTLKKLNLLMIPLAIASIVLIVFMRDIMLIWIGPKIRFSDYLVVFMGIYTIVRCWNNIYAIFVSGIGDIKLHTCLAAFAGIINVPVSVYLAKYGGLGNAGVILGTVISLLCTSIPLPIQTYFILKKLDARKGHNNLQGRVS